MIPFVYIASPYTKGDQAINTRFQCLIFDKLMDSGLVYPYAPLWSHFQHTIYPRPPQDWIDYELAMLERMDACLRMDAVDDRVFYSVSESPGADDEVARFRELGKPVFYGTRGIDDLLVWARSLPR